MLVFYAEIHIIFFWQCGAHVKENNSSPGKHKCVHFRIYCIVYRQNRKTYNISFLSHLFQCKFYLLTSLYVLFTIISSLLFIAHGWFPCISAKHFLKYWVLLLPIEMNSLEIIKIMFSPRIVFKLLKLYYLAHLHKWTVETHWDRSTL